jgi:hypothetical protein
MLAEDANNDGTPELDPVTGQPNYVLSDATESNALVLGVSITQTPICAAGQVENDPNNLNLLAAGGTATRFDASGPVSGGTFTLKALAGGTGGDRPVDSSIHQVSQSLPVSESISVSSWAGSVE